MSQTAAHSLNPPQLGIQNLYWIQALQNNKPEKSELINLNNSSENANSFPERFCLLSHSQLPDKEQERVTWAQPQESIKEPEYIL